MKFAHLQQNRRFLLALPVLVLPFLALVFHNLHGGAAATPSGKPNTLGLNTQLPSPVADPARAFENKLKAYQQADNDSSRKAQYQRQDPYRRDTTKTIAPGGPAALAALAKTRSSSPPGDNRANQLLQQLAKLRQSLHQNAAPTHYTGPVFSPSGLDATREPGAGHYPVRAPEPQPDPQLDRLNAMLDKLIRIQHPSNAQPAAPPAIPPGPDAVGPADTTVNTIRATIPEDQTLTNGATIALRLTDPIRVEGRTLGAGRLVYGTTSFSNDRLLIQIHSLREDANLYTVDWQVVDLDGLPGIHMPALLGRDVAKQSADQGIGGLNVLSADPTLGAQAANAGLQAAKSFLSHKVRQVRVTVSAGYQVLLRPTHESPRMHRAAPPPAAPVIVPPAPDFPPAGPVLAKARNGGVELILKDIRIKDSCLWFGLEWKNRSAIGYTPAYARCCIRSRGGMKRSAVQEQTVEPLAAGDLAPAGAGATLYSWVGFPPFALSKEKVLVLLVGERSGDRVLTLKIRNHHLLNAKADVTIPKVPTDEEAHDTVH